jgi:hypothetical protein
MSLSDPLLNDTRELSCFRENLKCFCLAGDKGVIAINHVPLPPAPIEVVTSRVRSFAKRDLNHVKRNPVVSSADDAITSACNRHFCSWECCIVGGRETPVCRRSA